MARSAGAALVLALWVLGSGAAGAEERAKVVTGAVTGREASWTQDGRRIVTTVTIATELGPVRVKQLGGSVGGIGMIAMHAPAVPRVGADVTAELTGAATPWVRSMRAGRLRPGASIDELPRMEFTRTIAPDSGAPLYWDSGCVFIHYQASGTDDLPGTSEFEALDASVAEWQQATASCGYLQIVVDEPLTEDAGFDRTNMVIFRDQTWGRPTEPDRPYDPQAGGITSLFFIDEACAEGDQPPCYETNPRNGELLDADIELNAVNFSVSSDGETLGTAPCRSDLRNTFTHELGHLFGLDHTCYVGGGPRPSDGDGEPVPDCNSSGLPDWVVEATMYNFQDCGETKKATLEEDDVDGFCAIYPISEDPGTCEGPQEQGGCCTVAAGRGRSPGGGDFVLLAFAAVLVFRARRSYSA